MSTTLLDPASLAKVEFVVYWIDSFLPGYHEINFLFPNSRDRAIRLVPKADPKCADMKKLAQALVKEVQLFWFNRAITDLITVRRLNARTGWNDGNWWQPIVIHNRRVRAEHEAKTVVERFGDVSRIDQPTKERLASMVNNETIDIVYFESQALPADRQGNRPSIKTLKRNRESRADAAMLEAMAEREQRANLQLASTTTTTTQDETKAEGQSTTTNQELAVNETIVMDTASSTNRESTTLEEAAAPTHDTAATLPESNRPSSEIVGRADTTADEGTVEVAQTSELEELSPHDDIVAVASAIGRVSTSQASFTSAVQAIEPLTTGSISGRASDISRQQSNALTTDLVIESVHGSPEEALDTPQLHLQDLNSGGDPVLPSSQILTTLDTILQSSSPQPNTNTVSSTDTASAHQMPGSHQGPIAHHQSTGTGQQHVQPPLAVPHHTAYPRGWNNLKWAYRTHTIADIELQQQGIWLFERPTTFHEHRRLYPMADMALPSHSQVIVAPSSQAQHTSGFLADGQTLVLLPHASSWHPDMRSTGYNDAVVPDSVFTTRLTEYQATEALGYEVWRHDRKHLPCANPVCQMVLSDHGKFTRICLSCGPKSTIRYCSEMCQAADLYRHSQDCGLHRYLIRTTIDDGTAPPRFSHIFPAIRNRHGVRTSVIQRQRLYAQITDGRYTLFDPTNGQPTILVWDYRYIGRQEFPYRGYGAEMEARIERCLNIALFDHTQTMAIEYLFRLLQQCLRIKGASQTVARTLSFQFAQEFNFHAVASWRVAAGLSICECEWSRDDVVPHQHTASCKLRYRGQGEMIRGRQRSLKKLVEAMEARYWILRAWRKQHPTETDWQRRVLGHGFPGCVLPAGWVPRLGKGWVGYWGPEDDICG